MILKTYIRIADKLGGTVEAQAQISSPIEIRNASQQCESFVLTLNRNDLYAFLARTSEYFVAGYKEPKP